MSDRLETEQWVPFPLDLVFSFFADPSNLPRLMPPALRSRIDDLKLVPPPFPGPTRKHSGVLHQVAAGAGSEILISFCPIPLLPVRVSWTARIVEFVWDSHFIDEQIRGPFHSFRHRHGTVREVRDGVQGTVVSDSVSYSLPGGSIGNLGQGIVGWQLKQSFIYRQKRLPELLALASRDAAELS